MTGSGLPSRAVGLPPALLGVIGLTLFAAVGEILPRLGVVAAEYAPPTSRVLAALADEVGRPEFRDALLDTLTTWFTGLAVSVAAGVTAGMVIGSVPLLREFTASTIEFLRPIPSVALIPLVIVLLGTGMASTLTLVVYASFWQVLVQVLHGVADVDPIARETARSYRLGPVHRMRYLIWPTALPYAATGVRLAASVALILTITGELTIGTPGLGKQMDLAYTSGAVASMYALIVVTGLIGVVANTITRAVERRALAWHASVREEVAP